MRGDARLDALAVKRRDGSPLVAAERIAVALDRVDVFAEEANIAAVTIDAPGVDLKRLADGTLELAHRCSNRHRSRGPGRHAGTPADQHAWTVSIAWQAVTRGG